MERDTLILQNIGKAEQISRAFHRHGVDWEDMRQEAYLALVTEASRVSVSGSRIRPEAEIARGIRSRLVKLCGKPSFLPIPSVPYEEAGLC